MNTCPVCGYDELEFPPTNFTICGCCGTEFGYDDRVLSHYELRERWIQRGCTWFDGDEEKPPYWNPYLQMTRANLLWVFRGFNVRVILQSNATIELDQMTNFGASPNRLLACTT